MKLASDIFVFSTKYTRMVRSTLSVIYTMIVFSILDAEGNTFCSQLHCDVNKCLPESWACDGEQDCHDGTDEHDCYPSMCDQAEFQCSNHSHCMPIKWRCDGDTDCADGSDEVDCANMTCPEDLVSCGKGSGCIPASYFCDGHIDCPGGLDENTDSCSNKTCSVDEFQCRSDDRCISDRWRCDGDTDCSDGSDEENCPAPSCDALHFQCSVNITQCIPLQWLCDGGYDCHDHTDELNCSRDEHSQYCDVNEFRCKISHECIHKSWVCDGDKDCGDSSDEQKCGPQTCRADEFQCRRIGNCIPSHWRCDGNVQCDDHSDEDGCITRRPCNLHTEFDCSRGKEPHCIQIGRVCDRINDCGGYEDESSELCSSHRNRTNPCATANGGCLHNCVRTALGHYCTCHTGFRLKQDNETCEDIDECAILGSCSQECYNLKGSFKCSCHDGYVLSPNDHRTCLAKGEPSLIYTNRHSIISFSLHREESRVLKSDLIVTRAVDYDFSSHKLFVSDAVNNTINRFNLSDAVIGQTEQTELIALGRNKSVDGLAFDWIHNNLYWTDSSSQHIEVLRLGSGSGVQWQKTLMRNLDGPKAIVLDPRSKKYAMYWTECGKSPKISSASLDGTNIRPVILPGSDVVWPNGLTIDYEMNVLYWIDMKLHLISSIDVGDNGPKDRRVVLSSLLYLKHPYSLSVFEDFLYWSDWQTQSVLKINKFSASSMNVTRIATRLQTPMGVQVYHRLRQPAGENVCKDQCSHICLPSYSFRKFNCACPNNDDTTTYMLGSDHMTCIVRNSTELPTGNISVPSVALPVSSTDKNIGETAGIVVGVMSLVMISVAAISYCVIKRHKRRNIKSMNFDNPVYCKRSEDQFSLEKNEYNPSVDLPEGASDVIAPLRLSCENYSMSEK